MVSLLDDDAVVFGKVRKFSRNALACQVFRRGADNARVAIDRFRDQVRSDFVADADVEIDALGSRVNDTVKNLKANLEFWMFADQFRYHGRYMVSSEAKAAADPHSAPDRVAARSSFRNQPFNAIEHFAGKCMYSLTRIRQHDTPGSAMEQLYAQVLFEERYAL